jgi:hypothetical protein
MPAFEASLVAKVDMIETDIHQTADGELIIIHDRSVLRTTGIDRFVTDMTLAEIRQLDAGSWFGEAFAGTKVPTVAEFLEWVSKTELLVNWELKDYPEEVGEEIAFGCADKLIDMIRAYGMERRSMVNSFSNRVLEHIYHCVGHEFPIHGQGIYRCRRTKDEAVVTEEKLFDWCCLYPEKVGRNPVEFADNFAYCKAHDILPCVCIPDREDTYAKALELGCRMFTSNDIYEADRILRILGYRK